MKNTKVTAISRNMSMTQGEDSGNKVFRKAASSKSSGMQEQVSSASGRYLS